MGGEPKGKEGRRFGWARGSGREAKPSKLRAGWGPRLEGRHVQAQAVQAGEVMGRQGSRGTLGTIAQRGCCGAAGMQRETSKV